MAHIRPTDTTDEVLVEVGRRIRAYRLAQNLTQSEVADRAGVGAATVKRAEAGDNPRLGTLIRILRALGRLDALEAFLPEPSVSPIRLADSRDRTRKRARPDRG